MKIIFIGCVEISAFLLKSILDTKAEVVGVITLKESELNSDFFDLAPICKENNIPFRYSHNVNSQESIEWIKSFVPDVIFCMGWSRLLSKSVLDISPLGAIGFHPASLPMNRGRHPIIWALVLGLNQTSSTFFLMNEKADSGDIISQEFININYDDNARTLYNKVVEKAENQLKDFIPKLIDGKLKKYPQDLSKSNVWRKRSKIDGYIDWRMNCESIRNLVRALSKPYIGASFFYKNNEIKVWQVEKVVCDEINIEPGKVLEVSNNQIVIKCGTDAIKLTDFEPSLVLNVGDYL